MKIALTGASGFIGRHVLAQLQKHPIEIIAITRNASHLSDFKSAARIVEMDICKPDPDCFVHLGCPDVLLHLAWDGLPNYKSLHHFETELPSQYQFLKCMIQSGLQSVLAIGTCFEYGMQSGALVESLPTRPNNPYGYAKDALRLQLQFLKAAQPFNLTWARLFYLYGSGQPDSSLYPKLMQAILHKDETFDMSGGEQLRDYLPVAEVARILVALALKPRDMGVLNVCSGVPVSVRHMVEKWRQANHSNIRLNLGYYPYPDYEPMAFWGDRQKLNLVQI